MTPPLSTSLPDLPVVDVCVSYARGASVQALAIRYGCGTRDVEAVIRANSTSHKEQS